MEDQPQTLSPVWIPIEPGWTPFELRWDGCGGTTDEGNCPTPGSVRWGGKDCCAPGRRAKKASAHAKRTALTAPGGPPSVLPSLITLISIGLGLRDTAVDTAMPKPRAGVIHGDLVVKRNGIPRSPAMRTGNPAGSAA
jgi:hypothetical protein